MNESSGACEEGTAEAGREFDPLSSEDEERRDDEPPSAPHEELGITHGSPLPAAARERLKEEARRGGPRDRGGTAQRDRGD